MRVRERDFRIHRDISVFIAAEPRHHRGSPRIYSGEERFSAPKQRQLYPCALALGTSSAARHAAPVAYLEFKTPPGVQRPVHFGGRFSRNDDRPSVKSGVHRMSEFSWTASEMSRSSSACDIWSSSRLVRSKLVGLEAISVAASFRAAEINSSGGTTSFTSPIAFASAASNRRPESAKSRVRLSPIWRRKNTDTNAGTKPMRTSVYPN